MIFSLRFKRITAVAALYCTSLLAQTTARNASEGLPRIEGLNAAQQKSVETYIRENERPSGEVRFLVDRHQIAVVSSSALRLLFPDLRFVVVPWRYEAAKNAAANAKYSIPGPSVYTIVLDQDGKNRMATRTGYLEEYGELLRTERVSITNEETADLVKAALTAIYGIGMGRKNLRHGTSEWFLGYQEFPFRALSSYEEVREASYYRVETDTNGVVIRGRLINEVLERRKIQ